MKVTFKGFEDFNASEILALDSDREIISRCANKLDEASKITSQYLIEYQSSEGNSKEIPGCLGELCEIICEIRGCDGPINNNAYIASLKKIATGLPTNPTKVHQIIKEAILCFEILKARESI